MAILGPANQRGGTTEPDSGFFDPATGAPIPTSQIGNYSFVKDAQGVFRSVTVVTDQLGNQFYEFNVADPGLLQDLGFLPKEGGTGRAPPSFASTQAAQTQAETFARGERIGGQEFSVEQTAAQRAFEEEQREIDRELRLREARLSTARDLVGIRSAEAREARTQGVQLAGQDFGRFIALARGLQAPTGTTPAAGFKQNLAQAGSFQAPELAGLDSAALESVIGKLSQSITPAQSPFGFAHGGVLSPSGAQGGTGAQAIPIGENGPEIMILRPDGSVEVVPMARGAQEGGVFDLGGFTSLFNRLRGSTGLVGSAGVAGTDVRAQLLPSELSKLGVGGVPQAGSPAFQAFSEPLSTRFGFQDLARTLPGFSGGDATRIANLIGFLPAPFKIPTSFFQGLLPAEKNALISAYRLAGVQEADFTHLLTAPQLSATPQRATAVG